MSWHYTSDANKRKTCRWKSFSGKKKKMFRTALLKLMCYVVNCVTDQCKVGGNLK